jgi:hypothetical protein
MTSRTIRWVLPPITADSPQAAIARLVPLGRRWCELRVTRYDVRPLPQSWFDWILRRPPQWEIEAILEEAKK